MSNSAIQVLPGAEGQRGAAAFRNKLINGMFDIWQRDTSFFGPVLPAQFNVDQYTADRWIWTLDDDGGQVSTVLPAQFNQQLFVAGQTEVPRNPTFFIRGDGIVIVGGGGSEFSDIQQRIEDVNTFSGETATLSFYARSSETTPSLMISLQQFFGLVLASAPQAVQPQVISLSGTWQRFVITFNVPSVLGKTITAGNALRVRFANIVGPTVAASLSVPVVDTAQFDLANVQFEIGSVASSFEKKLLATELDLAQRYYEIGNVRESTFAFDTLTNEMNIPFMTTKRSIPSIKFDFFLQIIPAGTNVDVLIIERIKIDSFNIKFKAVFLGDANITTSDFTGDPQGPPPIPVDDVWTADAEL